jgi:amino acid permease
MASSARDYEYDEKGDSMPPPHMMDETPIARGVRTNSTSDEEHAGRRGSRKQSVVASIKANYGLAEAPAYTESIKVGYDSTHRKLKPRHIQLIGIGGTIGTALYVQIGRGLLNGGPGSLFLAFTIW